MSNLLQNIKKWYGNIKMATTSYKVSGIRPLHDWKIIIITTIIFLLFMAGFAFYFYIQIDGGKLFIIDGSQMDKKLKIDNKLFKKVVDDINLKKSRFEEIKNNNVTPPADPSI